MAEHTLELANADATRELGRRLADELLRQPGPGPALLLLHGELGAGKTCLVQGLAQGLGINEAITSPSFALAQHYEGCLPEGQATHLVHLDLYRLEQRHAADELFAQEEEVARELGWLLAVEWPERLCWPPCDAWRLRLEPAGEGRHLWLQSPSPLGFNPDPAAPGPAAAADG